MTFTEAAVEVLRAAGKPLHYKKITEIAIEKNLLSHVGKTPETTMSSRLATMVKKDRGDAPIIKVKPGVFALREGSEESAAEPVEATELESEPPEAPSEELLAEEEATTSSEDEPSAAAQGLPGADVFPEEDDDDELILANLDDDSREGRKPRKRRSRRRRDRDPDAAAAESKSERRSATRGRSRKAPEAPATRAAEAGEPVGRELSDAIETALRGRGREPKSLLQVAEGLIESGRLAGTAALLAPTLAAAIRGDNAKRRASGKRPRFREGDGSVSLLEWDLPSDAVNAERDAVRAADRQRQSVYRALLKRLRSLPDGALLELLATWLNAVGVHSLRAVRADAGDFNLAGSLRRGPEETPLAISIYRGKQPVGKDAVVALRGGLHEFDHARMGWVITLGQVLEGAAAEGHAEGAAPCAVFDADALAASMEEVGVAIQRASIPLAVLDVDLLDSLGAGAAPRSTSNDESSDGDSSKRRRGRRRGGRRRESRDEAGDQPSQDERLVASEPADQSEPSEDQPQQVEAASESAPEPTEDTKKSAKEPAPPAEAEVERL